MATGEGHRARAQIFAADELGPTLGEDDARARGRGGVVRGVRGSLFEGGARALQGEREFPDLEGVPAEEGVRRRARHGLAVAQEVVSVHVGGIAGERLRARGGVRAGVRRLARGKRATNARVVAGFRSSGTARTMWSPRRTNAASPTAWRVSRSPLPPRRTTMGADSARRSTTSELTSATRHNNTATRSSARRGSDRLASSVSRVTSPHDPDGKNTRRRALAVGEGPTSTNPGRMVHARATLFYILELRLNTQLLFLIAAPRASESSSRRVRFVLAFHHPRPFAPSRRHRLSHPFRP